MTGRSSGDAPAAEVCIRAVRSGEIEEIHATAVPADPSADAAAQTRAMYGAILERIDDVASVRPVVERVFGDLSAKETFLATRAEALAAAGLSPDTPVTTLECKPVDGAALAGVQATFLRLGEGVPTTPLYDGGRCCGVHVGTAKVERVYLSSMNGVLSDDDPGDATTQAQRMFERTAATLASAGFGYRSVVCTRIYVRRLLEWYDAFNAVRTPFYASLNLGPYNDERSVPSSTGIQGKMSDACECVMDVTAVKHADGRAIPFVKLHNPLQNEATDYGSAFARGGAVEVPGAKHVIISGTASIDEHGTSVHIDDPEGQARRTMENFEAILGAGGAGPADLYQATWYCREAAYASVVRDEMKRRGWPAFPYVTVVADVCRDDLLVEIDGAAIVTD